MELFEFFVETEASTVFISFLAGFFFALAFFVLYHFLSRRKRRIKKQERIQIFVFDIAFWGLLAALWIGGLWQIYYTSVEELSLTASIPESLIYFVTVVLITGIFILFRRRLSLFATQAKQLKGHRRKKR